MKFSRMKICNKVFQLSRNVHLARILYNKDNGNICRDVRNLKHAKRQTDAILRAKIKSAFIIPPHPHPCVKKLEEYEASMAQSSKIVTPESSRKRTVVKSDPQPTSDSD